MEAPRNNRVEGLSRLAEALELLEVGHEASRLVWELCTTQQEPPSVTITEVTEGIEQELVVYRPPRPPTPPGFVSRDGVYKPLRRPRAQATTRREPQMEEEGALRQEANAPPTATMTEESAGEAPSQKAGAPTSAEQGGVLRQEASTSASEEPPADEEVRRWKTLVERYEAAEGQLRSAAAESERVLNHIRMARQESQRIKDLSEASGIRQRILDMKSILRTSQGVWAASKARREAAEETARKIAEAKQRAEQARQEAAQQRAQAARASAQAQKAEKEALFLELEAARRARKDEEWGKNPGKFFCLVCGLPGVRYPKDCPKGHRRRHR